VPDGGYGDDRENDGEDEDGEDDDDCEYGEYG
jgi:hypothetical protein